MAWVKVGSLRGPQGEQATTEQAFLAAHPVGSYLYVDAGMVPDPNELGGVWEKAPSTGPGTWKRVG